MLAAAAGTSQAAIARYEAGRMAPSVATLSRLLAALGLRLEFSASPVFRGPRGILLMRHLPQVRALCARHGARDPRVFGSVARGEDRLDSDVDLLVELEPGRTLLDLEQLQVDLIDMLGIDVDVSTEALLAPPVLGRIRSDLIAI